MHIVHLDVEALRELRAIMGDDFAKLLEAFAADSEMRIVAVQQAAAAADCEALRRAAHSFKGSSGNIGAIRLSDLCRQIEESARDGAIEHCLPLIPQLREEFDLVQRELERFTH